MNGQSIWDANKKQDFPTIEDIFRARELLNRTTVRKTPLQRSDTFSKLTGTNIFLKLESQSSGGIC
jgi:threonine dehydratase